MSFKKLIAFLFLTTNVYFLTVVVFQLFHFGFAQQRWSDFYICALILSVTVASFIDFKREDHEPKILSYELLGYLILFQIQVVVRVSEVRFQNTASLWLDEISQAHFSQRGIFFMSSANEHQPPLAYMSEHFMTSMFGYAEWAIRLTSAVFSALAGTLAFILFRHITKSLVAAFVLFMLLITFQMFYQYSIEARPVMVGVYFCLLYLAQMGAILIKQTQDRFNYLAMVPVGLMFLCSLGFQPPLMLLSLFTTFAMASLFDKKYLSWLYSIALSILLFLPVQATIITTSSAKIRTDFIITLIEKFELNHFMAWTLNYGWYFLIGLSFFVLSLLTNLFRKISLSFTDIAFFAAALVFLNGGSYFFQTSIDYPMQRHYLFLSIPLILVGVAYSYASIQLYLSKLLKVAILLGLAIYFYISPIRETAAFAYSNNFIARDSFKEAYKFIAETSNENDYLVQINLPFDLYSPTYKFVGSEIYLKNLDPAKSIQFDRSEETGLHNWLYQAMKRPFEPRRLYVFYSKNWNEVKVDFTVFKKNKNYYFTEDSSYVLIQIDNVNKNWKKEWFGFLAHIAKNENSSKSWVYNIYKIHQALINKDKAQFVNNYKLLAENAKTTQNSYYLHEIKKTVNMVMPDIEKNFGVKFLNELPQI